MVEPSNYQETGDFLVMRFLLLVLKIDLAFLLQLILWKYEQIKKFLTVRTKMAKYLFRRNFPKNAPYLKLFRDMSLFWNSIFRKSSFLKKPAWNSSSMLVFIFLIAYNSIFTKLSLKQRAFYWKVSAKGVYPHFGLTVSAHTERFLN